MPVGIERKSLINGKVKMMKKMVLTGMAVAILLGTVAQAEQKSVEQMIQEGESVKHIQNQIAKDIYDNSSKTISGVNGAAPGSKYPPNGAVIQSIKNSPNFEAARTWLYGKMRADQYGQVRIVLTPTSMNCTNTRNRDTDVHGIQCVSKSSVTLFFAPQTEIDKYGEFSRFDKPLTVETVGANYKTDGGVMIYKTDTSQSDLSTTITMLAIRPFDFAEKGNRAGPAVPDNQNWLPDNLLVKKKGNTGNADGFYSMGNALVKAKDDVLDSFRLENYTPLMYWVN